MPSLHLTSPTAAGRMLHLLDVGSTTTGRRDQRAEIALSKPTPSDSQHQDQREAEDQMPAYRAVRAFSSAVMIFAAPLRLRS
jgi:hypothetical protein